LVDEDRLEIGSTLLEIYGALLDISVQPIHNRLICCWAPRVSACLGVVSSRLEQMTVVPTSAYFLGHVSNAACSIIDMREAILTYFFFNPPGPGS
jgi:hypothetical protein